MLIYGKRNKVYSVSLFVFRQLEKEAMIELRNNKWKLVDDGALDRLIFWQDYEDDNEMAEYIARHEYELRIRDFLEVEDE